MPNSPVSPVCGTVFRLSFDSASKTSNFENSDTVNSINFPLLSSCTFTTIKSIKTTRLIQYYILHTVEFKSVCIFALPCAKG